MALPKIKELRAYVKKTTKDQGMHCLLEALGMQLSQLLGTCCEKFVLTGADCHDVVDKHWINGYPTPIANPMSGYPRYHDYRKSWGINAMGGVVVEVEAEGGVTGIGGCGL